LAVLAGYSSLSRHTHDGQKTHQEIENKTRKGQRLLKDFIPTLVRNDCESLERLNYIFPRRGLHHWYIYGAICNVAGVSELEKKPLKKVHAKNKTKYMSMGKIVFFYSFRCS